MPINDKKLSPNENNTHYIVKPMIQPGTFVLKFDIKKFSRNWLPISKAPFKVLLSINSVKNIELNGLHRGYL